MIVASPTTAAHVAAATVVVLCIGAVWWGVRRHHTGGTASRLAAAGLSIAGLMHAWQRLAGIVFVPSQAAADVVYSLGYGLIVAGLVIMTVRRSSLSLVGRAVLLDVIAGASGFGLLVWQLMVQPALEAGSEVSLGLATSYVFADVVIAIVVFRLALSARGNRAARWLLAAVGAVWAGDLVVILVDGPNEVSRNLYLLVYIAVAAAITRSDMSVLASRPDGGERSTLPSPVTIAPAVVALVVALFASRLAVEPVPGPAVVLAVAAGGAIVLRMWLMLREQRAFSHQLHNLAETDPLTGLPNRRSLRRHLGQAVASPRHPAVLLFIDLDRFKVVNDTHGHAAGDAVLVETAERLRRAVRADDFVARYGGDEFVVICQQLPVGSEPVVGRLEQLLATPVHHGGTTLQIGASVGMMVIDGETGADDLLAAADRLMYDRKRRGVEPSDQHVGP